ncbi:hypothetical protein WICMUC_004875 [Wickerhamomyces mucosus]|uniref:Uncharacterized protein n=1 Tax=Wickerhamomyces mucosus TaxID=1378264 RepID=A0A9P8T8Y9_9ASCO|nr:hypothetical protein WICMUC_004875 [Wickerhamomyces mucosus]
MFPLINEIDENDSSFEQNQLNKYNRYDSNNSSDEELNINSLLDSSTSTTTTTTSTSSTGFHYEVENNWSMIFTDDNNSTDHDNRSTYSSSVDENELDIVSTDSENHTVIELKNKSNKEDLNSSSSTTTLKPIKLKLDINEYGSITTLKEEVEKSSNSECLILPDPTIKYSFNDNNSEDSKLSAYISKFCKNLKNLSLKDIIILSILSFLIFDKFFNIWKNYYSFNNKYFIPSLSNNLESNPNIEYITLFQQKKEEEEENFKNSWELLNDLFNSIKRDINQGSQKGIESLDIYYNDILSKFEKIDYKDFINYRFNSIKNQTLENWNKLISISTDKNNGFYKIKGQVQNKIRLIFNKTRADSYNINNIFKQAVLNNALIPQIFNNYNINSIKNIFSINFIKFNRSNFEKAAKAADNLMDKFLNYKIINYKDYNEIISIISLKYGTIKRFLIDKNNTGLFNDFDETFKQASIKANEIYQQGLNLLNF